MIPVCHFHLKVEIFSFYQKNLVLRYDIMGTVQVRKPMLQELAFTGQWRHYQKRVLDKSDAFMADGHLHLVAAPGSGKTTLGIEFIRHFSTPSFFSSQSPFVE